MRVGSSSSSPRVRPRSSTCSSRLRLPCSSEDVTHQRVAVGVQPARGHRDHDVPGTDPAGAEELAGLDHAGGGAGDVVLVGLQQAGVLGGLAAHQGAAGGHAGLGDALDDRRDPFGYDATGGDVVGQEQRLGPADDEVVDQHADEVEADGVVLVEGLRDGDLGADAVGGAREQRLVVGLERARVEEPGETADAADHLGATGLVDPDPHQLDGLVTGLDRDAGRLVGRPRR